MIVLTCLSRDSLPSCILPLQSPHSQLSFGRIYHRNLVRLMRQLSTIDELSSDTNPADFCSRFLRHKQARIDTEAHLAKRIRILATWIKLGEKSNDKRLANGRKTNTDGTVHRQVGTLRGVVERRKVTQTQLLTQTEATKSSRARIQQHNQI